ncbi:MAG TPA: malate synthase G, partial [Candidatus Dormibacteraeota bacterium]|nr:malate synthase G [Candidatus Dormibacteraeota bacterium]
MTRPIQAGGMQVAPVLHELLEKRIAPQTRITPAEFWTGLERIVAELGPRNRALLQKRDALQSKIDAWHHANPREKFRPETYRMFLEQIGYLVPEGADFKCSTANVDAEIATIAGPQLVVPVTNARYALNAANARWGSLYDALYGTDVVNDTDGCQRGLKYNPKRGARVIEMGREFLDEIAPLAQGSHRHATKYAIVSGKLAIVLEDGRQVQLGEPSKFAGYTGESSNPTGILLQNNGLHVELRINRQHPIGSTDRAGVSDIILESAITAIQDFEDSVAAVDAEDKAVVYSNWLGLMAGTLTETFQKAGGSVSRSLNPDRIYTSPDGTSLTLAGRSLMLARNVGHHMYTDAVLDAAGQPIPEGVLDAMFTCLIARHDLQRHGKYRNSRAGSIYIVKPKMHGPEE